MVKTISDLEKIVLSGDHIKNASMKALLFDEDGFTNHVLRVVEVGLGGFTPKHSHPWYHVNYFLEGEGELEMDGIIHQVKPGSFAFVKEKVLHQFRNKGESPFKFICIVPKEGHQV